MFVTAQEEGDNDAKSLRVIHFKADALPSIPIFYLAVPRRYPVLSRRRFIAFSSLIATVDAGYYLYESVRWFLIALPSPLACLDLHPPFDQHKLSRRF
jgi:hypothetical protein